MLRHNSRCWLTVDVSHSPAKHEDNRGAFKMTDKLEHEGTEEKQPKLIMDCQKNDLQCFQTVSYTFLDFHFNTIREMYL